MTTQPSLDTFLQQADEQSRIALHMEITGDQLTPISAYLALAPHMKTLTLLESLSPKAQGGRYSHLCFNPLAAIESRGHEITLHTQFTPSQKKTFTGNPIDALRTFKQQYQAHTQHKLAGFIGGIVGFITYDAVRLIERIPDNNPDLLHLPDLLFYAFQDNISFDHETQKVVLSTIIELNEAVNERVQTHNEEQERRAQLYQKAVLHLNKIKTLLVNQHTLDQDLPIILDKHTQVDVDLNDHNYQNAVGQAKAEIKAGHAFQIVLSRSFSCPITAKPFDVYRTLRHHCKSPYLFYLPYKDCVITGASPEKLVSLTQQQLESCPLAGTKKLTHSIEDEKRAQDLKDDPKETAEHMMLVDLARNDLGAIAIDQSVSVSQLKDIAYTPELVHLSSTVQATLAPEYDAIDALFATLPAGTLSGAPKISAMTIIDRLEVSRRGIYGGTIAGIQANGDLTSCIAIRTATIHQQTLSVRAGAGIVYDSDPKSEADETRHKANTLFNALFVKEEISA